jgi:hypothetical protein
MSSNTKQIFYAIMAIVGVSATWYFNLQAMELDPNFSFTSFVRDNYVNPSSASIANDIAVILVVFFFWSFFEARRLGIKHWWVYVPLSIGIALAFAYPLFLLMRERAIAKQ